MSQAQKHPRISIDPNVMFGKPVVRGTRITVEVILQMLARGATPHDLLHEFPGLVEEDVVAALAYAADHVAPRPVAAE